MSGSKVVRLAPTWLALLLIACLSCWLVRVRHENQMLIGVLADGERARSHLEGRVRNAEESQVASDLEVQRLKGLLDDARENLARTNSSAALPNPPEPPPATAGTGMQTLVLSTNNIDPGSVRVIADAANVIVKLIGISSEEIEKLQRETAEVILGEIISTNAFARYQEHGTNVGIVLVFKTKAEGERVAAVLRGQTAR